LVRYVRLGFVAGMTAQARLGQFVLVDNLGQHVVGQFGLGYIAIFIFMV